MKTKVIVPRRLLRAGDVPEGATVVTLQTRRVGVVIHQSRGQATLVQLEDRSVSLHPRVMLEMCQG